MDKGGWGGLAYSSMLKRKRPIPLRTQDPRPSQAAETTLRSLAPCDKGSHRQCRGQLNDRRHRGGSGSDEVKRPTGGVALCDLGSGSCPGPSAREYAKLKTFFMASGIRFAAAAAILKSPFLLTPSVNMCR